MLANFMESIRCLNTCTALSPHALSPHALLPHALTLCTLTPCTHPMHSPHALTPCTLTPCTLTPCTHPMHSHPMHSPHALSPHALSPQFQGIECHTVSSVGRSHSTPPEVGGALSTGKNGVEWGGTYIGRGEGDGGGRRGRRYIFSVHNMKPERNILYCAPSKNEMCVVRVCVRVCVPHYSLSRLNCAAESTTLASLFLCDMAASATASGKLSAVTTHCRHHTITMHVPTRYAPN